MTNKQFKHATLVVLIILSTTVFAQSNKVINQAKALNAKHQYKASIKLLENYLKKRKDVYTLWLYGETLHKSGKYNKALVAYVKAIKLDPNNSLLKYDFALKSADAGKLNQAIRLLKPYAKYKNDYQFLALKELAKVYYWQGAYDTALVTIKKAKKIKNDWETRQLQNKILHAQQSYVATDLSFFVDDQPLTVFSPTASLGLYINQVFTVGVSISAPIYSFNASQFSGASIKPFATIHLLPAMASATLELGYEKLPDNETAFSGKLYVTKNVMKNLTAEATFAHTPYLHTKTAIGQKLMQNHYNFGMIYNDPKGFYGKVAFDQFQFTSENNEYYAASAWLLSPKINLSGFETRLGAGINYSDATYSTFTAVNDLETIKANFSEDQQIAGYYNPFFSPSKQFIASAIVSVNNQINNELNLGVDANFGMFATTQNPYLFLNKDDDNHDIIDRGFTQMNYFPITANVFATYKLTHNLDVNANYKYQSTNYYVSHTVGLKALYKF